MHWCFLIGALAPVPVWLAARKWPEKKWISYINMLILVGATMDMPPASAVNFTSWFLVGFVFQYLVLKYRKAWWKRYNYILSAGLDAGLAFSYLNLFIKYAAQDSQCQRAGWNTVYLGVHALGLPTFGRQIDLVWEISSRIFTNQPFFQTDSMVASYAASRCVNPTR